MEEPIIGVSLRPKDPFAKKIVSTAVESRNVLIKVTLPKRTGRKRKRGSDKSFAESSSPEPLNDSIAAPEFLRRLQDNEGKYTLEPVGTINETHRFRNLPDFQLIASDNAMMRELATHAFKPNYEALKNLAIDMTPGAKHITSFVAPPTFMAAAHPYRYEFNQAPGVKLQQDSTGKVTTTNIQAPARRVAIAVEPDVDVVPQGPPPGLKRNHSFGTYLDDAITALRQLLETRPLITRRVAMNYIPQYSDTVFKEATQWVGYSFRAGPWRDSLVKYGVDPRQHPSHRQYQTLMFQVDKRTQNASVPSAASTNLPESWQNHIFDGSHLTPSGKTWQICDVTDPLLRSIFDTPTLQAECDVHQFGWYFNGTLCKARAIMRDKIEHLLRGLEQPHGEYEKIARLPERVSRNSMADTYLADAEVGSKAGELAIEVRSMARLGEKSTLARAREGRLREALARGGGSGGVVEGEEEEEDEDEDAAAIDPALVGSGAGDETMQGDLEDDGDDGDNDVDEDEDEDAGADLDAVGELQDDDGDDEDGR